MADENTVVETKMGMKELCAAYDLADAKWLALKTEVEAAYREKSNLVEQMAACVAPESKFKRNGQKITIVKRDVEVENTDTETGVVSSVVRPTFFLRGAKKSTKKLIEV